MSYAIAASPVISPEWDEVFAHRITQDDDCWVWTHTRNATGYGYLNSVRLGGRWYAHRLSYTLAKGLIPDGLTVDHTCFRRLCIKPDHLRILTQAENIRQTRAWTAGNCQRGGHPKTPVSFVMQRAPSGDGRNDKWVCRVCVNLSLNRRKGRPDSSMCMLCGHQVVNHRGQQPGCDHCACDALFVDDPHLRADAQGVLRLMATCEGWAVVRRSKAVPFVISVSDWEQLAKVCGDVDA